MSSKNAREVAVEVLRRVGTGAFAAPTLDAELSRSNLSAADRALATELVYGTLRTVGELDRWFSRERRHQRKVNPRVVANVRVALYQMLFLDRIPVRAAIHESVNIARRQAPSLAGFVNAILRSVQQRLDQGESRPKKKMYAPAWVEELLVHAVGERRAGHVLGLPFEAPWLGVRFFAADLVESWIEQMRRRFPRASVERSALVERGVLVRAASNPAQWPGYREGLFQIQEEGSQLVAESVQIDSACNVADLCAGHGGKTAVFAHRLAGKGRLIAVDAFPQKLDELKANFERLRMSGQVSTYAVDLRVGLGNLPQDNDVVFVDAPCSGLGTIYRRPERMLHAALEDLAGLQQTQLRILRSASQLVGHGGFLYYAVCSPTVEEGVQVVEAFNESATDFIMQPMRSDDQAEPDGIWRIGPWLRPGHFGPDMFQMCVWRRL